MAYRATAKTEARKANVRQSILDAARGLVAGGGFREAPMLAVAAAAGVATGTVYRYFPSKADLFAELFRVASQREVDVMAAAAAAPGTARDKLDRAVRTFAERAIRGRRMAYALIAEPVDPAVETERLAYRRAYAAVLADIVDLGLREGACPPQTPSTTAAFLVGALAEALVGPLAPDALDLDDDGAALVDAIAALAARAVFHVQESSP